MTNKTINSPVSVTAFAFGRNMSTHPRRMEYDGMTYNFVGAGIRMVVNTSGRIAQIVTMSDGRRDFHLRSDNNGSSWTLLSISQ